MKNFIFILAIFSLANFIGCSSDDSGSMDEEVKELGSLFQGGIIFYIDNTGEHGLICSLEDQSVDAVWCDDTSILDGADGVELGTGSQNTLDILAGCTGNSAALICSNYSSGGYNDWFLPSLLEIVQINENIASLNAGLLSNGGKEIALETYWTSTESDLGSGSSAFVYNFDLSIQGTNTKFGAARVRAIRSF